MSVNSQIQELANSCAEAIRREPHRRPEDLIRDYMAKAVSECCGVRKQLGIDVTSIEKKGA